MQYVLPCILIPGAAGVLALFLPSRMRLARETIGLVGTFIAAVAGLALLDVRGPFVWSDATFHFGPLNVELAFRVDGFSSWAVAFATGMSFLIALYSVGWYRNRGGAPGRTYAFLLMATSGAAGALLASNLLLMVLFWEVVTLMLFLLAVTGREDGTKGAAKAFVVLGIGDMALLLGVVLLGVVHGAAGIANPLSVDTLTSHPLGTGSAYQGVIFLLFFVAASAKAGAMPFHSWIPTMSTTTPAPVMAFLPAAIDKVLGIYLLARICLEWCAPGSGLLMVVMIVGVITILGAVFMAMIQHDLRRLLSFHAVSQVGYMLLGIGTGTVIGVLGGVFHMLNHAIYKSCLFLGCGVVEREAGTTRLDRLGGLVRGMPLTFFAMLVAALAIAGIPPLNGFASKWLVYQSCVVAGQPLLLVAALFGSVLTLASFVKVLHSVFWGPCPERHKNVRESGIALRVPLVLLASACILLGVFAAYPLDAWVGPVVGLEADAAVTGSAALEGHSAAFTSITGETAAGAAAVEQPTFQPLLIAILLVLGVVAALLLGYMGHMRFRRVRSVFVGGRPLDPEVNTFPGTEFYRTVRELPGIGGALESGEKGHLDLYAVGGRVGGWLTGRLRRLHSGLLTDYLFWCLLGLALLVCVLFWR